MKRRIIKIDEDKCNGCGLCVNACHEGAIGLIDGKAKLLREDYCDGLGDCLPICPTNAISFIEKDSLPYDAEAVNKNKQANKHEHTHACLGMSMKLNNSDNVEKTTGLKNWPLQIRLVPTSADYYQNADLVVAADCAAFTYPDFYKKYANNRVVLIGCPKLDDEDYSVKLTQIIKNNQIKSVTIVRMQVPCCGGLENATKKALMNAGKLIPWGIDIIGINGSLNDNN